MQRVFCDNQEAVLDSSSSSWRQGSRGNSPVPDSQQQQQHRQAQDQQQQQQQQRHPLE
jgi:hypothetical protein